MRAADWPALQAKHNLPPPPGEVIDARWVAARDDWYVQTAEGWYWLRPESRTWIHVPLGPL